MREFSKETGFRGFLETRFQRENSVGEYSANCEVYGVSQYGVGGSKNVGTSNRNAGEIPACRKSKVSLAMVINQGLVGPKAMAKAAADGHTVNIP